MNPNNKANQSSMIFTIFSKRVLLAVMLLGGMTAKAANYVFMAQSSSTWHFYAYNSTSNTSLYYYATDATTFSYSTCVWSGTSGSKFRSVSNDSYGLYYNINNYLQNRTNPDNFTINGNRIYSGSYYVCFSGGYWYTAQNSNTYYTNGVNQILYSISGPTDTSWTTPLAISGDQTVFANLGSYTYTASAAIRPPYYTLTGNGTYYVVEGGTPSTSIPASSSTGITYTWSLNDNTLDDGHVRINPTTGLVEYYNSYSSNTNTTIKVTATHTASGATATATKQLTFNALPLANPTSITATDKSIAQGDTWVADNYTLTVPSGYAPYTYVTASSSNTAIATVANSAGGFSVTGVAQGSATITINAYKQGNSEIACSTTFTLTVTPPSSGVSGTIVTLNDLEDHSWSYYSDPECPIRSLNPADVKITYYGNGTYNINTTNGATPASNAWIQSASTVKVGPSDDYNTFVYYKTLERLDGSISNNPTGRCPYTTIYNPFSVRPTYQYATGDLNKYCGFYMWRIKDIKNGKIYDANDSQKTAWTSGNVTTANTLYAGTTYYFQPDNEYGMEVELEALWARAYVKTGNANTLDANNTLVTNLSADSYERNFFVITNGNTDAAINKTQNPVTITCRYPDGSSGGSLSSNIQNNFTANNGTKFEYVNFSGSTTFNANGKDLIIGRGCSGTVANLYGATSAPSSDFTLRVESGTFTSSYLFYFSSGTAVSSALTVNGIYGCDYDRANNETNTNLTFSSVVEVGYRAYATNANAKINMTVLSGTFGSDAADKEFYMGFENGGGGTSQAVRTLEVYGGNFLGGIAGGYDNTGNSASAVKVNMRIRKGTIHRYLYTGGQYSECSGARRTIITGGVFDAWVAGGAYGRDNEQGNTDGDIYIYFGGIASQTNTDGVFGAGYGNYAYANGVAKYTVKKTNVVIADEAQLAGNVYGGGNNGYATDDIKVYVAGGTIAGDVYGGANMAPSSQDVAVIVTGGTVGGAVYGGSNQSGAISGQITVDIYGTDPHPSTGYAIGAVYGGGNQANYTYANGPVVTIHGNCTDDCPDISIGEVYGGGNQATVQKTTVNVYGGNIIGEVYAGANRANVLGTATLNVYGGTIRRVFPGNNNDGTISGAVTTTINAGVTESGSTHCPMQIGAVFGGGNSVASAARTVNIVCTGDQSEGIDTIFGGANKANITSAITLNISRGHIRKGIYGGNNTSGQVQGKITVNVTNDGTCGFDYPSIFGGGFGESTSTTGDVEVNIGVANNAATAPTVIGDIYGGSALGDVNASASNTTIVSILNGKVVGNIYGGGLGRKADNANGITAVAAKVNGKVTVNVSSSTQTAENCAIDLREASIYGCNNANGSPQDSVIVNIYKTAYNFSDYPTGDKYKASYTAAVNNVEPDYAIDQVFGGGNEADYSPAAGKKAVVKVFGCDNTIRRVFGGGNAAATLGVKTTIGGGRFDYIFGGGNGEVDPANIGTGGTDLTVNSGVINHLFGGSNEQGSITGPMLVAVNNTGCTEDIKEFFAGCNLAELGTSENPVTLNTTIACGTKFGVIYGGSNLADIYGNITLTINGGTIDEVYTGSKGRAAQAAVGEPGDPGYQPAVEAKAANIHGTTTLNINAGAIGNAFGGSNINGNITGAITVIMDWSQSDCSEKSINNVFGASNLATYTPTTPGSYPAVSIKHGTVTHSVYGGGKGASAIVTSNPVVTIGDNDADHCAIVTENVYGGGDAAAVTGNSSVTYNDNNASSTVAKLFGGGNAASVSGTSTVTLTNGKVTAGVYGGCNTTGSVGAVTVSLTGGQVGTSGTRADVYGGGFGGYVDASNPGTSTTGNIGVTLNGTTVYGDLYGGSAFGKVNGSTDHTTILTISSNTLHGTIYGGGKGSNEGTGTTATSNGNVVINYNTANTNLTGLYGGANVNGNVKGNITVNVLNNVGASASRIDVFGGGLGAATQTEGNVTVTIGDKNGTSTPDIYGDVYGGSSLGSVNNQATDKTTVNILSGSITGNVYGGGMGETGDANVAKGQVNGEIIVNIGTKEDETYYGSASFHTYTVSTETRGGSVYGCNNTNGSPQDNVTVNVYKTAHNTTNAATYTENDATYAIDQVFGGGNQADYSPAAGKKATVHVYTCDNTIRRVFGGGNAAAALGVVTTIDGGRFDYIFGGGNGEATAANIGAGGTNLTVNSGVINYLFGGSNSQGTITGTMGVTVNNTGCTENIKEFFAGGNLADIGTSENPVTLNTTIACGTVFEAVYGGSNLADIYGNITLTINGGNIGTVYAGSKGRSATSDPSNSTPKAANIYGTTTLNIYAGAIGNAFGGSNINGNITGAITVIMDWSQSDCSDKSINNVFGASNLATYTPTTPGSYPAVNIKHGTVTQNVFGGGKGGTAVVTSNPVVTIGDNVVGHCAIVTENVYGGGDAAAVTGNTSVTYNDNNASSTVANLFGGGNAAGVSGTATVTLTSGKVTTGVYGGCNTYGTVGGAVNVYVNGGTVGSSTPHAYGVFGGGYGTETSTGDAVNVTIGNDNTLTPTIYGDVYGGSAKGNVSASGKLTKVWLKKGTITGDIYGGGFGDGGANALVNGNVQVIVDGGTVNSYTVSTNTYGGRVFGCNNANGTPKGTVEVTINATNASSGSGNSKVYALQGVYGGGNEAGYDPTTPSADYPIVTVNGCASSIKDVYGGGNAAPVPNTKVIINGGDIKRVFAGGNGESGTPAHIGWNNTNANPSTGDYGTGIASAQIKGGTIEQVFGGSNANGVIRTSSALNIDKSTASGACAMKIGEVYGGGNVAAGNAGIITIGCTGTLVALGTGEHYGVDQEGIRYVYGGANQANIGASGEGNESNITLNINSGIVENVFGGNNQSGTIYGTITVNIDSTGTCGWYVGNVYGGGNQATYGTANSNYPQVNISSGLVGGDVFGGGLGSSGTAGQVTGNPQVIVNGAKARVNGGVYGGGSLAPTVGNPLVTLTTGALTNVYGGGKAASITGAPIVNINGGTVSTGVYGGCNTSGNVSGNITVNVTGGTVGSSTNLASYTTTDVFGGGYGASTSTSGHVTVNINGASVDIYGDVYGGSALGQVNDAAIDTTTVNILDGTLHSEVEMVDGFPVYHGGNVYGGGLGEAGASNVTNGQVNGTVTVNIGAGTVDKTGDYVGYTYTIPNTGNATIEGNVYGCNNTNGSPQQNVTVNIFKTAHNEGANGYALNNVFGGGNQANFQVSEKTATVNIYGCDNTIRRTFGGGNAAATNAVTTMIQGGHINEAYGGGNGEVSPANVNGDVLLAVHGGNVDHTFAGSNQQGAITGGFSTVTIDGASPCDDPIIDELFMGGNYANWVGNIDATVTCAEGMQVKSLYGGCKQANVVAGNGQPGNVHLTVEGGTYHYIYGGSQGTPGPSGISADIAGDVILDIHGCTLTNTFFGDNETPAIFGGSHINGSIGGKIVVTVDDQSTGCELNVSAANVYGGGNQANYTAPYVSGTSGPRQNYPVVNIKKATVLNVFGGGLEADVTGNPRVAIWKYAKVLRNVYGGGNLGKIIGDPKVIINGDKPGKLE